MSQPAAGLQERISGHELHRIIGSGRLCRERGCHRLCRVRGDTALCRIAIKYAQSHICRRVRFDMSWQPGTHPQHAVSSTVLDTFNTTTQQARQAWQQALQEPTEHQQSARLQCSAVSSTEYNTYTQPSDLTAKSRPTAPKYLPVAGHARYGAHFLADRNYLRRSRVLGLCAHFGPPFLVSQTRSLPLMSALNSRIQHLGNLGDDNWRRSASKHYLQTHLQFPETHFKRQWRGP